MAEEVIGTWNINIELVQSIVENDNAVKDLFSEMTENGEVTPYAMIMRFEDADGQEIKFPVKLISDTQFTQEQE